MKTTRDPDAPLSFRLGPGLLERVRECNPGWELGSGVEPTLPPELEAKITSDDSRRLLRVMLANSVLAPDGTTLVKAPHVAPRRDS
jgi:hypothetical protein